MNRNDIGKGLLVSRLTLNVVMSKSFGVGLLSLFQEDIHFEEILGKGCPQREENPR